MPHCPAWEGAPVAPAVYHAYAMQGRRKLETCLAGAEGANLLGSNAGSRYLSGACDDASRALYWIQFWKWAADVPLELELKDAVQWELQHYC